MLPAGESSRQQGQQQGQQQQQQQQGRVVNEGLAWLGILGVGMGQEGHGHHHGHVHERGDGDGKGYGNGNGNEGNEGKQAIGPWSPSTIHSGTEQSPELDSVAILPSTPTTTRGERERDRADERLLGPPTTRHILESSPSPQTTGLLAGDGHGGGTTDDHRTTAATTTTRESIPVSELSSSSLSPVFFGDRDGSRHVSSRLSALSGESGGAEGLLSARGSWSGYMSPEAAMAGGWRDGRGGGGGGGSGGGSGSGEGGLVGERGGEVDDGGRGGGKEQ